MYKNSCISSIFCHFEGKKCLGTFIKGFGIFFGAHLKAEKQLCSPATGISQGNHKGFCFLVSVKLFFILSIILRSETNQMENLDMLNS